MAACTACPDYTNTTAPGATAVTACECVLGYTGPGGGPCDKVVCPPGQYGLTCAGVCAPGCLPGTCIDGRDGDGTCACATGWTTAYCNECDAQGGWADDGAGGCACAPGRFGSGCDPCPDCGAGTCSDGLDGDGTCTCDAGWAKDGAGRCTRCAPGHYGATCAACPSCHDHGACNDGVGGNGQCACATGFDVATDCATCAAGYYEVPGPGGVGVACERCHPSCVICDGPGDTACTSCYPTFNLEPSGACTCEPDCSGCADECTVCFGPAADACLACADGYLLDGTACGTTCSAGYYPDAAEGRCNPCHSTCATCVNGTSTDCTACSGSRALDLLSGACVTSCPAGTYSNGTHCLSCDESCQLCASGGPTGCTSCEAVKILHDGACLDSCPGGTYRTPLNTCAPCTSPCANCTTASTSACTACQGTLVLTASGQCAAQCPYQTYNSSGVCTACHASCAYCSGPADTECTACVGSFLQEGVCVASCAPGYYQQGLACVLCPAGCAACTGAAACTACTDPDHYIQAGACVAECAPGNVPDTSASPRRCTPFVPCPLNQFNLTDGVCQPCHSACQTCAGPTEFNCTSCAAKLLQAGECVDTCGDGYFPQGLMCAPCAPSCATCAGAAAACTACADPDQYLEGDACVDACSDGYVPRTVDGVRTCAVFVPCARWEFNNTDGECEACDQSCSECRGPGPANCTACTGKLLEDGACVPACSAGHYQSGILCATCPAECAACTSATACTECADAEHYLQAGACVGACGSGFVPQDGPPRVCTPYVPCASNQYNSTDGVCRECHPSCTQCVGGGLNDCTACPFGLRLQAGACVALCDDGFYPSTTAPLCLPCEGACATCSSGAASACTSCANASLYVRNGVCVPDCGAEFIPREVPTRRCEPLQTCLANQYRKPLPDGTCDDCHATCATCSGPLATECTACAGRLPQGTSCVETCSIGYYLNVTGARCLPCPPECAVCNSPEQCRLCVALEDYLQNGVCVKQCGAGFIPREGDPRLCTPIVPCTYGEYNSSNVCLPCSSSCLTCDGPTANNCTSCRDKYLEEGACVDNCSPGYWANSTRCLRCAPECVTCETLPFRCVTCSDPSKLWHNYTCVDACPAGTAASGGQCQPMAAVVDPATAMTFTTADIISAAVVPAVLMIATVAVYLMCRRIEPTAENMVIFTVSFGLFNVVTDALFVYSLFANPVIMPVLRYIALASVALPVSLNLVVSLSILARLSSKSADSNDWFGRYYPLAAFVSFVAAGCLGALLLLSSNICRWPGFMAVLDERDRHRIKKLEFISLFLEDLPQLAIQITVLAIYGVAPITVVTLIASTFAVLYNLIRRCFYVLNVRNRRKLLKQMEGDFSTADLRSDPAAPSHNYRDFMDTFDDDAAASRGSSMRSQLSTLGVGSQSKRNSGSFSLRGSFSARKNEVEMMPTGVIPLN